MKKTGKKLSKKAIVIICIASALLLAAIVGTVLIIKGKNAKEAAVTIVESEATVERRDISNTISGTSIVAPKDSYEITALVNGDIIFAGFEKGDIVNKDDILYRIDSSDTEKNVASAWNSLNRAQMSYDDAVEAAGDLNVIADYSGKVSALTVKEGDNIANEGVIAEIYDDTQLDLTVPFIEEDANLIFAGQSAKVTVMNNGSVLYGTVTKVMDSSYTHVSRMVLKDVTVRITNPGALTPADSAIAEIGGMYCNDMGNFEYITQTTLKSSASGTIKTLYIKEGDFVQVGQQIAAIENKNVTDAVNTARLSLSDAQLSFESAQDRVEDYTIKAPISGTVIEKNVKAGDKLDSSNLTGAMAIIYDMSALTFDLSIDETDIANVKVGQSVKVTADAIEGKMYDGVVTNISIMGTTSYGITTYPVTVEITEFDDALMPGMNIEAVIDISAANDVIAVPISAVNRGNTVYIKGEKESDEDKAPEGFKSVKVEIGISDGEYVEIKSGLKEGDIVNVISTQQREENQQMPGFGGRMPGGNMGGGMPGGNMGGSARPSGGMPGGGMR